MNRRNQDGMYGCTMVFFSIAFDRQNKRSVLVCLMSKETLKIVGQKTDSEASKRGRERERERERRERGERDVDLCAVP